MSAYDERRVRILNYLDNSLQGQELADFRAHLEHCENCRASLEAERDLSLLLRRSRPLYSAPPTLRAQVATTIKQHTAAKASMSFGVRLWWILRGGWIHPGQRVAKLRLVVAGLVITAALVAFFPSFERQARAADYVEQAVVAHRSSVQGNLPLELRSNSPEQVTAWFGGKVPFSFRLPRVQVTAGSVPAYQLIGAGLREYRGKPVALVTYQKQNEKISLMVASADSAVVAGGEEIRSGNLTFHYRTEEGFNVVTWTNHGLSYALVSSVSGPARESCMVCHQSMADQQDLGPTR